MFNGRLVGESVFRGFDKTPEKHVWSSDFAYAL